MTNRFLRVRTPYQAHADLVLALHDFERDLLLEEFDDSSSKFALSLIEEHELFEIRPRWTGQNRPIVDTSKPAIPVSGIEAE